MTGGMSANYYYEGAGCHEPVRECWVSQRLLWYFVIHEWPIPVFKIAALEKEGKRYR